MKNTNYFMLDIPDLYELLSVESKFICYENANSAQDAIAQALYEYNCRKECICHNRDEVWLLGRYKGRVAVQCFSNVTAKLVPNDTYPSYNRYMIFADILIAEPSKLFLRSLCAA